MINVNLADAGNTGNHALKKIIELGYRISIIDESAYFSGLLFVAEKNKKFFFGNE